MGRCGSNTQRQTVSCCIDRQSTTNMSGSGRVLTSEQAQLSLVATWMHDNPNQPPAIISPSDATKMTDNAFLEEEAKISAAITVAVGQAAPKRRRQCQVPIAYDMQDRAVALAKAAGYAEATTGQTNKGCVLSLSWP